MTIKVIQTDFWNVDFGSPFYRAKFEKKNGL